MDFNKLFKDFGNIKIAVIGDVMLDTYLFGKVERISPEAPVPVVAVQSKQQRIGGAGNVALNTVALGAETFIISVIGSDDDGKQLDALYRSHHINTDYLITSNHRITTNKIRILGHNQQMMRLDSETTKDINTEEEDLLLSQLKHCIASNKPDVVIFEDYNKGLLKENVIKRITEHCKELGIVIAVDPKRKNFLAYKGVTIFKPNLREVREGLHLQIENVNEKELNEAHRKLGDILKHEISFITLSEKGVFYNNGFTSAIIPSRIRNIADVSGAGDTVIATASLVYALTKDVQLMAEISNLAGGLVCEEVGVVSIKKDKLRRESELLLC